VQEQFVDEKRVKVGIQVTQVELSLQLKHLLMAKEQVLHIKVDVSKY
jgi:hypothetical protein